MKSPISILALGLALTLPVIGCSVTADDAKAGEDVDSSAAIADGLSSKDSDMLNKLRDATEKYRDVKRAVADGFQPLGGCASSPPFVPASQAGAMGIHYANLGLAFQPVNPLKPSILLYEPQSDGQLVLVGVEYVNFIICNGAPWMGTGVPNDPSMPPPYATQSCSPSPAAPPSIFGSTFDGPMPGHEVGMPWHFDKHVWIWRKNPIDMFAQWNPRVVCR